MMYQNLFRNVLWACCLFCFTNAQAQKTAKADEYKANKKGFFVGAAYIYNYCKPSVFSLENHPTEFIPNSNPNDSIYRFMSRNKSTATFGIHVGYNKSLSKAWSLSLGLEIDQRKEMIKYLLYEDARTNSPDPVSYLETHYAFFVPLRITYYKGRFMVSAGNNMGFSSKSSVLATYNDGSTSKSNDVDLQAVLNLRETLSYRLLRNKGLYIQLSAEQTPSFYEVSGYNHFFMAGGAYYF